MKLYDSAGACSPAPTPSRVAAHPALQALA